jgi:hypothetical protein
MYDEDFDYDDLVGLIKKKSPVVNDDELYESSNISNASQCDIRHKIANHTNPDVKQQVKVSIVMPSNSDIEKINNNKQLSSTMKHDLIELHKTNLAVKQLIMEDIDLVNARIKKFELRGGKLEFGWNSYVVDDIVLNQDSDPVAFTKSLALYDAKPGRDFDELPIDTTNMFSIIMFFSVPGPSSEMLSEVKFIDIAYVDSNNEVHRTSLFKYEKE